jgi:lipase maturation factor 1
MSKRHGAAEELYPLVFDSGSGPSNCVIARWIFLRALAAIYFSAFFSLVFQTKGLIGQQGNLPAQQCLTAVARSLDVARFWYAPSLFWLSAS